VGDLGVPRVKRAEPTLPVEFNLSEARLKRFGGRAKSTRDDDAASDAGSTQSEPTYSFKARPLNRKIMEGAASGLKQATPRKTTRPVSPKLSTTARMRPEVPAEPEPTFAAFKARPMPDHSASPVRSPRKVVARPVTSPKPFSLTSVARHELYEEGRERALEESRQAEQASRNFKARPMPVSEAWKPAVEPKHTTAEPFELKGESRSEVHKAEWEQKLREQEAAATKERAFKARPPTVLEKAPFEPRKSTKPLTDIVDANFKHTVQREERRKAFQADLAQKRAAKEAEVQAKAAAKAAAADAELAKLRKSMEFKARPVKKGAPMVITKATARPLTQPASPAFATRDRPRLAAAAAMRGAA